MRVRKLSAVAAVTALVVLGLTACDSKVGVAAVVDGHRITDSQVAGYLTPDAQPFTEQGSNGGSTQIPQRSFVLNVLIQERLLNKVIKRLPNGGPKESDISQEIKTELQGHTPAEAAKLSGVIGYTPQFVDKWVRDVVLNNVISSLIQQGTVDGHKLLDKLSFDVTVSGRYGSWDAKTYSLQSNRGDGLPGFLTFHGSSLPATDLAPVG